MAGAKRTETFQVDREKIFQAITDYEKYPEFVDGVHSVKVLEKSETGAKVQYSAKIIKNISYTLQLTHESPKRVSWKLVEGDIFKTNNGEWILEDKGNGQTEVTYSIDIELKIFAPKAILDGLVTGSLPSMMKSFANRAK